MSKKQRGHSDYCAENMWNLRSCFVPVMTLFQYGINFRR